MQIVADLNSTTEYNIRTLKNKDGHYPSWLSGRQRKRLQSKQAILKRNAKKKKIQTMKKGNQTKSKIQDKKNNLGDSSEVMITS